MALEICQRLERLNASCQGIAQSLSGTTAAVEIIMNDLKHLRDDNVFQQMFENVNLVLEASNLQQISLYTSEKATSSTYRKCGSLCCSQCLRPLQSHF